MKPYIRMIALMGMIICCVSNGAQSQPYSWYNPMGWSMPSWNYSQYIQNIPSWEQLRGYFPKIFTGASVSIPTTLALTEMLARSRAYKPRSGAGEFVRESAAAYTAVPLISGAVHAIQGGSWPEIAGIVGGGSVIAAAQLARERYVADQHRDMMKGEMLKALDNLQSIFNVSSDSLIVKKSMLTSLRDNFATIAKKFVTGGVYGQLTLSENAYMGLKNRIDHWFAGALASDATEQGVTQALEAIKAEIEAW